MKNFIWKLKMVVFSVLKALGLRKTQSKITVEKREISEEELPPQIKAQLIKKYGHL